GLMIDSDVLSFVHITGNPVWVGINLRQGCDSLGSPRCTRLAIAGEGFDLKDPAHVCGAVAFTAYELGDAILPSAVSKVLSGGGMNGMPIGMIADRVLAHGVDHVLSFSTLQ